jgi:hypothetical protein
MKAYCISVKQPQYKYDPDPFVAMDHRDIHGDLVQITLKKEEAEKVLTKLKGDCPDCTYNLIEFEVPA